MNLDLPSHRRILFLLLFVLFLVIGFATRYLLVEMGWVDESSSASTTETSEGSPPVEETGPPSSPADGTITEEDRQEAKDIAVRFVKAYLEAKEKGAFLREAGPWMTREFQAKLEADSEELPGPLPVQSTEATRIEDYELERNGKIAWDVWVTLKEKKRRYEVVYQVILNKDEGNWKVEGVAMVEYPEHPD
jgi:hypothetical protein